MKHNKSQPLVSVVIPQRGNQHLTEAIVSQLRKHHEDIDFEIVVVNDGAGHTLIDGSVMVDNRGEGVTAAWNTGITRATSDNILLLNNDVTCNSPFLREMVGGLSPMNMIGASGRTEVWSNVGKSTRIDLLEGWCLLFMRCVWTDLLEFDESMSVYYSDTDFQIRAMDRGIDLVATRLPLVHLGHATASNNKLFKGKMRRLAADKRTFREKHAGVEYSLVGRFFHSDGAG